MSSEKFCNLNNILSCFPIISGELEILGFDPIAYEDGNEKQCIINLLNTMWSLICSSKKQVLKINELNEKMLNCKRQLFSHDDAKKKSLFLLNDEKDKSMKFEESLTKIKSEKEKLTSELKELKKELTSIRSSMTGQQMQYEHDIRRKDAIIEDLKLKLFNSLEKKNIPKIEKTYEEGKCESFVETGVLRKYMASLQNNIQLLLDENVNLRASIVQIYTLIFEHFNVESAKGQQELLFKLPYQNIISEIEKDIKNILHSNKFLE